MAEQIEEINGQADEDLLAQAFDQATSEIVDETQEAATDPAATAGSEDPAPAVGEGSEDTGSQQPDEKDPDSPEATSEDPVAETPKPEEGAAEGDATPGDEEPEDDFPETPKPDDWKRLRDAHKLAKAERRKLTKEADENVKKLGEIQAAYQQTIAQIQGVPAAPATDSATSAPTQTTLSPDEMFLGLAQIERGELEGSNRLFIEHGIAELSPTQITDIIRKGEAGQFGEASVDVVELAEKVLPRISADWGQKVQARNAQVQFQNIRNASIAEVKAMEGMADPTSEQFKKFEQVANEINTKYPGYLDRIPDAALQIVRRIAEMDKLKLAETEMPRLLKENQELRDKEAKRTAGLSPGQSFAPSGDGSPEDQLEKDFAQLGVG